MPTLSLWMLKKEVYNPAQNISGRNLNKKENLDSNEGDVDESVNLIDEYQRESLKRNF